MKIETRTSGPGMVEPGQFCPTAQDWTVTPWPEKTGIPEKDAAQVVSAASPLDALALAITASAKIAAAPRVLLVPAKRPSDAAECGEFIGWKQKNTWLLAHRAF